MSGNGLRALAGPHEVDAHVGRKLRARRRELFITQGALAKSAGVSFQQIQKYEQGANRVSASTLVALATALNVNPGYFVDDAPGSRAAPNDSEWVTAMKIVATVSGAAEALQSLAALPPPDRVIAVHALSMMAGRRRGAVPEDEAA